MMSDDSSPRAESSAPDNTAQPQAPRHIARRAVLAALAVAALGAGAAAYLRRVSSKDVQGLTLHAQPRELPPLPFTDDKGAAASLTAFRGRVVLLNVWATWCAPCREEMPTLDRLQDVLGGPGFEVVAVSIDTGGLPVAQAFYRQIGIQRLRAYVDSEHEVAALVAAGIPLTLLIDRDGREVGRKVGPAKWDDPRMIQLIRGYLPAASQRPEAAAPPQADVVISDAWARATVAGQPVGAAYFNLTSAHGATLTGVRSDAAETVQFHQMTQDGGVMRMREVERLELPAHQIVRLAPGGVHVMLMQLKRPLRAGDSVTLEVTVVGKAGKPEIIHVVAPVRSAPPQEGKP